MEQFIFENKRNEKYIRYILDNKNEKIYGRIVLEKYDNIWNLELMEVIPQNKGYGTYFLKYVLDKEKLDPKNMTVCPISSEAKNFFIKNGFIF